MTTPPLEVWFVLPSANEANCRQNLPAWRDQGYRVALLQDRVRFDADCDALVTRDRYPGWGASVNTLFREVVPKTCRVIVAGGDDMLPDPGRRADEIAGEFLEHFAGDFGVMQPTGDAYERTEHICGSPWIGRAWMERMYQGRGGMPECYTHQWADDELYWVSRCAGRFWSRPDLSQYHDHFLRRNEPAPRYWVESAGAHNERDCLTFIARSRSGFPGASPLDEPGLLDLSVFDVAATERAEAAYRSIVGERGAENTADRRMRTALQRCADAGHRRVAIYGAGQHTRRLATALLDPPAEVVAIIDDDPERVGTRLWNYPVVSREHAMTLGLDAVVLSSDAMEDRLRVRAACLELGGAVLIGLYASRTPTKVGA